jgi:hypothetical protein
MTVAEELEADEATRAELVMARRFVGQRCILDPQLIVPMRLLWAAFKDWSRPHGHRPSAVALRLLLEASPWSRVEELQGRGRIRVMVHGVAVRA